MPTHPRRIPRLVAFALVSLVRCHRPRAAAHALRRAGASRQERPANSAVLVLRVLERTPFPPSHLFYGATNPLLLTDGTVLVEDTAMGVAHC